jgi:hypothetical protein
MQNDKWIFFTKLEGLESPYRDLFKETQVLQPEAKAQETKNEKKKTNYNRFWIHKSNATVCLVLTLRARIFNSESNTAFALVTSGGIHLKIRSFLTVQMAQHIKNTIAMLASLVHISDPASVETVGWYRYKTLCYVFVAYLSTNVLLSANLLLTYRSWVGLLLVPTV